MLTFREGLNDNDPQIIRNIAASTGFFDKEDIDTNYQLAHDWIKTNQNNRKCDVDFLLVEMEGKTIAYACFGKIPTTESSYELYWLSTHNEYRGCGVGRLLMRQLIDKISQSGGTKLFVKTDGTEQYLPTRRFYESCGFMQEACLKGYYGDKDDCCIYSYKIPHINMETYNVLAAE